MENKHQKVKKKKQIDIHKFAGSKIDFAKRNEIKITKKKKTESQNLLQLLMLPMHRNKI